MSDNLKGTNVKVLLFDFSSSPQKMKYMLTMQSVPHERVLHVRVYSTPVVTELSVNHTIALQSMYMVIMAYHQTLVLV